MDFDYEYARKAIAEVDSYRKYWYGDFYNLTGVTSNIDDMIAYQFYRKDLNAGVVYVYRRQLCCYAGMTLCLQGLDEAAMYQVTFVDDDRQECAQSLISGADLMYKGLDVKLPKKSSMVIHLSQVS